MSSETEIEGVVVKSDPLVSRDCGDMVCSLDQVLDLWENRHTYQLADFMRSMEDSLEYLHKSAKEFFSASEDTTIDSLIKSIEREEEEGLRNESGVSNEPWFGCNDDQD